METCLIRLTSSHLVLLSVQQTTKKFTPVARDALQPLPISSKICYLAHKKHAHSSFLPRYRRRKNIVVQRLESLRWRCHSRCWYHCKLCCEPSCCPLSSLGSMPYILHLYNPLPLGRVINLIVPKQDTVCLLPVTGANRRLKPCLLVVVSSRFEMRHECGVALWAEPFGCSHPQAQQFLMPLH